MLKKRIYAYAITLACVLSQAVSCGRENGTIPEFGIISVNGVTARVKLCHTYRDRVECFVKGNIVKDDKGILLIYPGHERPFFCNIGNISPVTCIFIDESNKIIEFADIPVFSEREVIPKKPVKYVLFSSVEWAANARPDIDGTVIIPEAISGIESEPDVKTLTAGGKELSVEIADDDYLRRRGLMYRKHMPENSGMLFVYQQEEQPGFWMKNTFIPLSIAYIKPDLTIAEIHHRNPHDLEGIPPQVWVKYVLEVNKGWFERNNVKTGDKITIPALP